MTALGVQVHLGDIRESSGDPYSGPQCGRSSPQTKNDVDSCTDDESSKFIQHAFLVNQRRTCLTFARVNHAALTKKSQHKQSTAKFFQTSVPALPTSIPQYSMGQAGVS